MMDPVTDFRGLCLIGGCILRDGVCLNCGATQRPVRQRRPVTTPRRSNPFGRACRACGADFLAVEGGSHERGVWHQWAWYCSQECAPESPDQDQPDRSQQ